MPPNALTGSGTSVSHARSRHRTTSSTTYKFSLTPQSSARQSPEMSPKFNPMSRLFSHKRFGAEDPHQNLPPVPDGPDLPQIPDLPRFPNLPRFDLPDLPQIPDLPRVPSSVKFRVLIIGRANAGKTSILQRVCDTTESPEVYRRHAESENRERVRPHS
jgi:hypothetical protein